MATTKSLVLDVDEKLSICTPSGKKGWELALSREGAALAGAVINASGLATLRDLQSQSSGSAGLSCLIDPKGLLLLASVSGGGRKERRMALGSGETPTKLSLANTTSSFIFSVANRQECYRRGGVGSSAREERKSWRKF